MFKKIIKFTVLSVLCVFVIFALIEIKSSSPAAVLSQLSRQGKLDSRNINLKLNYLAVIPVGEANLRNLGKEKFRGEELVHLRGEAKTFDYVRSMFHAKAVVDSYSDPREKHSVYFLQHLEMINKPDEDKELHYDQKRHVMTYKGPRGTEERVIEEGSQDPLSAIMYLQENKFDPGEEFSLNFNTNQKNYVLKGKFLANEYIKIRDKDYEMSVVEARVGRKDKNPRHQTSFKIWFLKTGGSKIPILLKAMTNVGPIVARAQ
ncbi:MAG: DUF3108 domain-containing protein [Candidatus Omnitrophota bacterium]